MLQLQAELGYQPCGINGCILADQHTGQCVFEFAEGKRRRGQAMKFSPGKQADEGLATSIALPEPCDAEPAQSPRRPGKTRKLRRGQFTVEDEATIIRMRREGITVREIADKLGRSVATMHVKWRALRMRNPLLCPRADGNFSCDGSPNASPASERPQRAAPSSSPRCTAAECCRPGTRTHLLLSLPLCDAHAEQYNAYDSHSWPTDADGDDDACQWCCGVSTIGTGEPPDSESLLCDNCGMAWCNLCLARNLGAEYWDEITTQAEEEPWHCLYCDPRLLHRLEEWRQRRGGSSSGAVSSPARLAAQPAGAPGPSLASSGGATPPEREVSDAEPSPDVVKAEAGRPREAVHSDCANKPTPASHPDVWGLVKLGGPPDQVAAAAPPPAAGEGGSNMSEVERLKSEIAFLRAALAQKEGSA